MYPFIPAYLTQKDIAQKLDISTASVAKYLKHPEIMSVKHYKQMLSLGVQLPMLVEYITCEECHGTGLMPVEPDEGDE
jgi:hypothetical protein